MTTIDFTHNQSSHCESGVTANILSHHGRELSEAMAFGNPVVATGYSGNLEFMNGENSFLVNFQESRIRSEELGRLPPRK